MSGPTEDRPVEPPEEVEASTVAGRGSPGDEEADRPGSSEREESVTGPGQRWWTHRLPTRSGALIGVLLALLGFALAVQLKSDRQEDQDLSGARQEDLVRILDDLDARKERLRREISSLNGQKQQVSSGQRGQKAALSDARRRADELGILAGTLAAEGPGLSIRFSSGRAPLRASVLLDAVEELRGAGAEAMQVGGAGGGAVRVVASTSFVDWTRGVQVGSVRLTGPYTLAAIGDPGTMQAALNIPGGVVDTVRRDGGDVRVREPHVVHVSSVRQLVEPRYARPVS